ncbi:MAG: HD-GYP domain-containing protein [Muribaculaceae bacterium]|nr:HD-GYP domain-containing protein [Roseburia sp.]MCM1431527.1 HD-GYP domain-containing protein [Muribaculaceae bacterium]MCM1493820.1 HD-GYP domain-containing protein [Muribaculaceae bacterium]
MNLAYNIDFEIVGIIYVLVVYAALNIYYSNQSKINKKFKVVVKFLLATEIMDIVTAITISYGSVIPPVLNILLNTIYFVMTFSLGYFFLRYVESYVEQSTQMDKSIHINKTGYVLLLALLVFNMFFGFLFTFHADGTYVHGGLYVLVYIVPLYYVLFSLLVLIRNQRFFNTKQKISIGVYIIMCLLGPLMQMLLLPNVLLSVFTPSIAILVILFSMETPDYQLLMKTLAELDDLRKNLQIEVKKQTKTAEDRREKVERLSGQVILTLARTIDAKDKYTNGHSERVAAYSREIARRLGMSAQEQQEIYYMGLLHDIGKIGISDTIINKSEKLTDEEYQMMRKHPELGGQILAGISEIPGIAIGAKYHHEKFDGTGYPYGVAGEDIPFQARIIGIADAYDAMASKRSYRDVLPQQTVREEIKNGRGTQFDPRCTDVMLQMIDEDTEYQLCES